MNRNREIKFYGFQKGYYMNSPRGQVMFWSLSISVSLLLLLHYITLHYITLHYITLHYVTSRHVTSRHVTLRYVTLHYITLYYIILFYIIIYWNPMELRLHNMKIKIILYCIYTCSINILFLSSQVKLLNFSNNI